MWFNFQLFLGFALGNSLNIEEKKFQLKSISAKQESLDVAFVKTFPSIRSALVCALMTHGLNKLATNYNDDQECIVYDETLIQETDVQPWSLVHLLEIPEPDFEFVPVDFEEKCPNWKFDNHDMVLEYTLELNQCVLIEGLRGADAIASNAYIEFQCAHQFWHPNETKILAKINPELFELQTADNCLNGRMDFKGFYNAKEENDTENQSENGDDYTLCSKVSVPKTLEAFDNPRIEFLNYGGNLDGMGINFTVCAVSID
ncbi:uncharacterized protein LOC131882187 [Tigriopus californicus]|uniref:uncharacterized protein LOC131882187 n=1 Tax=Tigriopus californicus TaxID=6832 RepID=UPI0027DA8776|nr:uncharacterized protein LOC131882187 [Tigriopus californicus]